MPTEQEQKVELQGRLKEAFKDSQVRLARTEQEYRRTEAVALYLRERLESLKENPNLTQGQLKQEEFRLHSSIRSTDQLDRAWTRLSQAVSHLQTTLDALDESQEASPLVTQDFVNAVEVDLKMKRQELEDVTGTVVSLDSLLHEGHNAGASLEKVNQTSKRRVHSENQTLANVAGLKRNEKMADEVI